MKARRFNSEGYKECYICKELKEAKDYYPSSSYASGYRPECIGCTKIKAKAYPKTKDQMKNTRLKCAFGISLEEYKQMHDSQNGVCAICGKEETAQNRPGITSLLAVDHDHSTGKIRDLLCQECNKGLGHFKEDENSLLKAVEYLRKHKIE